MTSPINDKHLIEELDKIVKDVKSDKDAPACIEAMEKLLLDFPNSLLLLTTIASTKHVYANLRRKDGTAAQDHADKVTEETKNQLLDVLAHTPDYIPAMMELAFELSDQGDIPETKKWLLRCKSHCIMWLRNVIEKMVEVCPEELESQLLTFSSTGLGKLLKEMTEGMDEMLQQPETDSIEPKLKPGPGQPGDTGSLDDINLDEVEDIFD